MIPVELAVKVLRADRRTRTATLLTAVGVAVATGLVLLLLSLPYATQARAERSVWQKQYGNDSGGGTPTLSIATSTDFTGGRQIDRVDVAALAGGVALPAGVPKLPAPGEVLVSPELYQAINRLPASQLADRLPGRIVGTLGEDALRYPDQMVALVGHSPETMPSSATERAGFLPPSQAQVDGLLTLLAGVGVVVLLVPSLVLVASSARLIAARRERRLAALRLAGATPGQVVAITAAETGIAAVAGALLGWAAGPLLWALARLVPWDGGTWLAGDFRVPAALTVATLVAVPVLVVLAAVLGLRRVVRNPVGAVVEHTPKPLRWWRLLSLPATAVFFFVAIEKGHDVNLVLLGLALMIVSAMLVGPYVTAVIGGLFVSRWRKPATLLAGRRLRNDPRGAYRASAGVVLAVFTGSMALTLMPSLEAMTGGGGTYRDSVLSVDASGQEAAAIAGRANATLARYNLPARAVSMPEVILKSVNGSSYPGVVVSCTDAVQLFRVQASCDGPGVYHTNDLELGGFQVAGSYDAPGVPFAPGTAVKPVFRTDDDGYVPLLVDPAVLPAGITPEYGRVAVDTTPADAEVVRTALVGAAGGERVFSRDVYLTEQRNQLDDLRRVTVIGVTVAAVLAGCSAAIATAGSVMDRRRTFGALMAAGTPTRVLSRALRMEAALPALVATIGSGVLGMIAGLGLFSIIQESRDAPAVISPWLAAPVVLGLAVAVLAASACTPALNRVRAEPLADE
ncbi:FtsX-like permease family protein [Amycolatopsis thermophila]|uniref:ABC-type lipoprotein release transport system permease subunit n=1 Tax=Amycolatopsis thermophila TaxID=206084 RepID=A0ABU0ESM0_9PSEU|nr:FtsX-like permease family protein [Amycolatopsis thermophila]MDQ0378301.1 ABC-type lipoprotein release transport system permease subunit [Amycolatopsis thermophila]